MEINYAIKTDCARTLSFSCDAEFNFYFRAHINDNIPSINNPSPHIRRYQPLRTRDSRNPVNRVKTHPATRRGRCLVSTIIPLRFSSLRLPSGVARGHAEERGEEAEGFATLARKRRNARQQQRFFLGAPRKFRVSRTAAKD